MSKSRIIIATVAIFILSGCDQILSDPKINSSTDESFKESTDKVRESLAGEQKKEFDEALRTLTIGSMDMSSLLSASKSGDLNQKLRAPLNGMNAQEIIAQAKIVRLEREAKEKRQALEEIKELEAEKVAANNAKEKLKLFKVVRSRFYVEEDRFRKRPFIELTVKNGTGLAVSRAYFEGTVSSPGRSVPWIKETFNYEVPGGVEPEEETSWTLAPNSYSDWGRVTVPEDAIFTVTVEKLDGADGEPILDAGSFTERKARRLAELTAQHKP